MHPHQGSKCVLIETIILTLLVNIGCFLLFIGKKSLTLHTILKIEPIH